jgi:hypothetical protein
VWSAQRRTRSLGTGDAVAVQHGAEGEAGKAEAEIGEEGTTMHDASPENGHKKHKKTQ